MLFIFSGLPGSGKSTLAVALARQTGAVYIRVDTIEQALRDLCGVDVEGEGYQLGYRIALDNLRLGLSVVADSCNPIELTRREWERVALDAGRVSREHRGRVQRHPAASEQGRIPAQRRAGPEASLLERSHLSRVPPMDDEQVGDRYGRSVLSGVPGGTTAKSERAPVRDLDRYYVTISALSPP